MTSMPPLKNTLQRPKKRKFSGGEESLAKKTRLSPGLRRIVSKIGPGTPKTSVLRRTQSCFVVIETRKLFILREGQPTLTLDYEARPLPSLSLSSSGSTTVTEEISSGSSSGEVGLSVFQIAAKEETAAKKIRDVLNEALTVMHAEASKKKRSDKSFRLVPPWGKDEARNISKQITRATRRLVTAQSKEKQEVHKSHIEWLNNKCIDLKKFKISRDIKGLLVDATLCAIQGRRPRMEDAHVIEEIDLTIAGKTMKSEVIALFDGHGGKEASELCAKHLVATLKTAVEKHAQIRITKRGMRAALNEVCAKLDQILFEAYLENNEKGIRDTQGTTFACALILDGVVWTVNLGDSRVLLVKQNGTPVPLTFDQKPENYAKQIKSRGGQVFDLKGTWRLNGSCAVQRNRGALAVAGFLGDHYLRETSGIQGVRPGVDPTVSCADIDEGDRIVVADDGLWDIVSLKKIAALSEKCSRRKLAVGSTYGAYEVGSTDNISVIVADYKGKQRTNKLQNILSD